MRRTNVEYSSRKNETADYRRVSRSSLQLLFSPPRKLHVSAWPSRENLSGKIIPIVSAVSLRSAKSKTRDSHAKSVFNLCKIVKRRFKSRTAGHFSVYSWFNYYYHFRIGGLDETTATVTVIVGLSSEFIEAREPDKKKRDLLKARLYD